MMIAAQQNSTIRRNHERDLSARPPNAILIACNVVRAAYLLKVVRVRKSGVEERGERLYLVSLDVSEDHSARSSSGGIMVHSQPAF
jgi:hypothetical protein